MCQAVSNTVVCDYVNTCFGIGVVTRRLQPNPFSLSGLYYHFGGNRLCRCFDCLSASFVLRCCESPEMGTSLDTSQEVETV